MWAFRLHLPPHAPVLGREERKHDIIQQEEQPLALRGRRQQGVRRRAPEEHTHEKQKNALETNRHDRLDRKNDVPMSSHHRRCGSITPQISRSVKAPTADSTYTKPMFPCPPTTADMGHNHSARSRCLSKHYYIRQYVQTQQQQQNLAT